jgi:hypothetical protein
LGIEEMAKRGKLISVINKRFDEIGVQKIHIYLDKKNGFFYCDVPEKIIKPSNASLPDTKESILIENDYICKKEYQQILNAIDLARQKFNDFDKTYQKVILIKFENYTSRMDGSGRGLQLNWGVFRKYDNNLVLESSNVGESGKHQSYQYYNDWKEVPYSDKVKDFLLMLDKTIDGVREKLDEIINSTNFEDKIKDSFNLLN